MYTLDLQKNIKNKIPLSYNPTTATVAPSHPALYYYYASIP